MEGNTVLELSAIYSVGALNGILLEPYFRNFLDLVSGMRMLPRKEQYGQTRQRQKVIADEARKKFKTFFMDAKNLYEREFVVHNVHCLIHLPDDYVRFGPFDNYSCFHYESFSGKLKKCSQSGFEPMKQVLRKYRTQVSINKNSHNMR